MVINFLLGLLVVVLWGIALAGQSKKKVNGYKGRNLKVAGLIKVDDQELPFFKVEKELPESVDR
jgi:hypothetical protein